MFTDLYSFQIWSLNPMPFSATGVKYAQMPHVKGATQLLSWNVFLWWQAFAKCILPIAPLDRNYHVLRLSKMSSWQLIHRMGSPHITPIPLSLLSPVLWPSMDSILNEWHICWFLVVLFLMLASALLLRVLEAQNTYSVSFCINHSLLPPSPSPFYLACCFLKMSNRVSLL